MHSGLAYIVSNVVLTIMWMTAGNIVLDNKYSKIGTITAESVIQLSFWYLFEHTFPLFTFARVAAGILVLCLLLQYFHTDRVFFKLITGLLIYIATSAAEMLLGSLIPYEMIVSGEIFAHYDVAVYSVYLLLAFMFLSVVTIGLRAYKQRYQKLLVEKQWFIYLLFPLSQTIMMCTFWASYLKYNILENPYKILSLTVLNLLADVALIYAIRQTGEMSEIRIRSEMLEEQIRSQENYYDQLASTYSNIRKMRHDIDNHIYAIESLLKSNDIQSASEYIQKIHEEDTGQILFADCHNTVVMSYLTKKLADFAEAGITLETDIHLPYLEGISNPDLICIYGNILDNAKDACGDIKEAVVNLNTSYNEPYLIITCFNPAKETDTQKKRRIPELERGIGFTILSNLASQYDGQFINKSENGMFYTEIILKIDRRAK